MLDLAVAGLAAGGTYALVGVCIVLLHRMGAVVNFSQTFGPALAVFAMTDLLGIWGLGLWSAVALAVILGTGIAALQGLVMATLFRDSDVMVRSAVSMAMAIALFALAVRIFHDTNRFFPGLFASISPRVGSVRVPGPVIVAFCAAVAVGLALWAVLRFTRIGVILRAVSSRPVTAELMGVRTTGLIVGVWALSGAITTAALILVAPARSSIPNLVALVIPGLAAAVFGGFRSFGLTVVGGVVIGAIESMALDWGAVGDYRPTLSFLVVSVVLLWRQRKEAWSEAR